MTDLKVTGYPFRQTESIFAKEVSNLLIDFNCFLVCSDRLEEVVHVEVSLDRFDKIFVFWVIIRHLMKSVIVGVLCDPKMCRIYS